MYRFGASDVSPPVVGHLILRRLQLPNRIDLFLPIDVGVNIHREPYVAVAGEGQLQTVSQRQTCGHQYRHSGMHGPETRAARINWRRMSRLSQIPRETRLPIRAQATHGVECNDMVTGRAWAT